MSNRRKFSAEFKAEAVELVISSGRPVVQVSADIGVNEGTLGNWVRDLAAGASRGRCRPAQPG